MWNKVLLIGSLSILINLGLHLNCNARTIVEYCPQLPEKALTVILGPAFNPRYMSIDPPARNYAKIDASGIKRESIDKTFAVDDTYEEELSEKPAWEVNHITKPMYKQQPRKREATQISKNNSSRRIRQLFLERVAAPSKKDELFKSRPWECKASIRWIDLGADYFPRYIRSVECTKKECWYGHYTCKPRSFTVKVLRRKSGQCARISQKFVMVSLDEVTGEFIELWVWEEKAVNFCCDCVMTY